MNQRNLISGWMLASLFGLVLTWSGGNCFAADQSIRWQPFESGLAAGEREDKKIFLHFYADWCRYCKIMQKETFTDPAVIQYLNEHFIAIKINSEQDKERAREYRVSGLPTTWFLSQSGEKIGNRPGFIPAKDLLSFLKYVSSNSYKTMSLKTFMDQSRE
ncbi:MAG: thioredoxin family protein [Thermodesulfobacteriota bacterium]